MMSELLFQNNEIIFKNGDGEFCRSVFFLLLPLYLLSPALDSVHRYAHRLRKIPLLSSSQCKPAGHIVAYEHDPPLH